MEIPRGAAVPTIQSRSKVPESGGPAAVLGTRAQDSASLFRLAQPKPDDGPRHMHPC